jgi:hypothetical protein
MPGIRRETKTTQDAELIIKRDSDGKMRAGPQA